MCGRYATSRSAADLSAFFEAFDATSGLSADYNVAPTDPVPVVRMSQRRAARVLDTARWGLVPSWAADPRAGGACPACAGGPRCARCTPSGARMINARAETVATARAFAPSFARRRCLVPADGWYEWVRTGKRRQAFYLTPADGSVLAFAGLWSARGDGPDRLLTCSVVTTAALGDLTRVHERMPLILSAARWGDWLAGGGDAGALLCPPSPAELAGIEIRPVGPAVGNVRNNGPDLTRPIDLIEPTDPAAEIDLVRGTGAADDHQRPAVDTVVFPTQATLF